MGRLSLRVLAVICLLVNFLCRPERAFALDTPCQRVKQLVPIAEKLRGLTMKRSPSCHLLDEEDFKETFRIHTGRHLKKDSLRNAEVIYRALGLVPADFPYAECYFEGSSQTVPAFYDGTKHRIVLSKSRPVASRILVHELVHALQEDNFSLENSIEAVALDNDRGLAFAALLEGDAVHIEELYVQKYPPKDTLQIEGDGEPPSGKCAFTPALQRIGMFPYEEGYHYVSEIRKKYGQEMLNSLFQSHKKLRSGDILDRTLPENKKQLVELIENNHVLLHEEGLGRFMLSEILRANGISSLPSNLTRDLQADRLRLYQIELERTYRIDWQLNWQNVTAAKAFSEVFKPRGWKSYPRTTEKGDAAELQTYFRYENKPQ